MHRLLFIIAVLISLSCFAQSEDAIKKEKPVNRHSIGAMLGYAWVPQTVSTDGTEDLVIIPTIGLDYGYALSHKLSLVFVNDLELTSYFVEDNNGATLKRENKYIAALTALYYVNHWFGIYAGPGIEFEQHKNFAVLKVGAEIYKHFEEGWGVGFNASVDINESYQTLSAGVVVSRSF